MEAVRHCDVCDERHDPSPTGQWGTECVKCKRTFGPCCGAGHSLCAECDAQMPRHLELYPLQPLCGASDIPFVATPEERDVNCPQCRRLMSSVRWTGTGWVRRTPGVSLDRSVANPHRSSR